MFSCERLSAAAYLQQDLWEKRYKKLCGEALEMLGPACCACEWSFSLRAVRGEAELAQQRTCLGAQSANTRVAKEEAAQSA